MLEGLNLSLLRGLGLFRRYRGHAESVAGPIRGRRQQLMPTLLSRNTRSTSNSTLAGVRILGFGDLTYLPLDFQEHKLGNEEFVSFLLSISSYR